MFHSALYAKPQELSTDQIAFGLEKCFGELETATATLDRLSLAREAFSQIPTEHINAKTVNLFTSSFVDLPSHFVPETSALGLERAYSQPPKEMFALALESSDGIIAKIKAFIKKVCEAVRNFFKALRGKYESTYTFSFSTHDILNADITPTEDFAVFVKRGEITVDTMNGVSKEMSVVANNLLSLSTQVEKAASTFTTSPDVLNKVFSTDGIPLNPKTDWPGQVFFELSDDNEASLLFPSEKADKPAKMEKFSISRTSALDVFVKNIDASKTALVKSIDALDKAMAKIEKEADAIKANRYVSSDPSSGDVNDVTDVEAKSEADKSPLAMKMFVKVVGTFSKAVTGVSIRFLDHELKAASSLQSQVKPKG